MKYLVVFLLCIACAKAPDAQKNDAQSIKVWSSSSPWWSVDLKADGGLQVIHWSLAYGQVCESAASLANGVMTIALSTQTSAVQGSDVPCSMFDGSWTYSVSNNQLTICQSGQPCVVML